MLKKKTVKKSDEEMKIVILPIEENVAGKREKEVETEKEADKKKEGRGNRDVRKHC